MFRIGMKVVAIRTHSNNAFTKGAIYKIEGVIQGCCNCLVMLEGVRNPQGLSTYCPLCNKESGGTWFDAISFRPIQDQYTEEEIEAVNIDELVEPELVEV